MEMEVESYMVYGWNSYGNNMVRR